MRIALTFNEKRSDAEHDAEFDTMETIHALARTLASMGHIVTPVEVSGTVDGVIGELRRVAPELVFNVAEGTGGQFREAFYPALLEQLGLPHTGSGASALALSMDKALAKRVVAAARVPTPMARLVRSTDELGDIADMAMPVIVKPNFEGSSKGITQASVVTEAAQLASTVTALLDRYPAGVLVEQYVDGVDVAVGWVDGIGLLPPIGYAYEPTGEHRIYDLGLKQGPPEHIDVQVPAKLDAMTIKRLLVLARRAFDALGIAGYGRADFRVTPDGAVYFLEMNPLPTLDPRERDLYAAAAAIGRSPRDLLGAIVDASWARRPRFGQAPRCFRA
jgi:D-alanine-D-alanine ligase